MTRSGLEVLLAEDAAALRGDRVGLLANHSAVDRRLRPAVDRLAGHDAVDLRRLFSPEHGLRGTAGAGVPVADTTDDRTGLPVTSLYGEGEPGGLDPETLADLDALVYDIQGVGCRFYTYTATLGRALEAVAAADRRLVVLDRPNPIAPLSIVGNRIDPSAGSLVGDYGLPIVHGLTPGELAGYVDAVIGADATVDVVELEDWHPGMWIDATGLPWVPPSPNMPTTTTATVYPGTCLVEGTTLSEGRGTTKPFELIGAPWIDPERWAAELRAQELPGVRFRPAAFTPRFDRYADRTCGGVQIHVTDRDAFEPVEVGLTLVISAVLGSADAGWSEREGRYVIDGLVGGSALREAVAAARPDARPRSVAGALLEEWAKDRRAFRAAADPHRRY